MESLNRSEQSFLEERHAVISVPFATFWEDPQAEVQQAMIPALIRGGTSSFALVQLSAQDMAKRGLLAGTTTIELKANGTSEELAIVQRFVDGYLNGGQSGMVYSGVLERNDNRIEGRMLQRLVASCI